MITEVRAKNCFSFDKQVIFSLKADMRNKRFATNVNKIGNFNVLKTAGIYGSNNAGKTNVIRCILAIWSVLMNRGCTASNNIFSGNPIVELGITFIFEGREFEYNFKFDTSKQEYVYEYFCEIFKDSHSNERREPWLLKDAINNVFEAVDEKIKDMAGIVARNNILMYLLDTSQFEHMNEMKRILTGFASKIDVIDMNNIPLQKTIDLLKNKNSICEKMVNFIKNADLYMDNYYFAEPQNIKIEKVGGDIKPQEDVLNIPNQFLEQIRLTSVYKGVPVPSLLFDSTGTKKIAALASYIIEALENGRILIVDELDRKSTRLNSSHTDSSRMPSSA